MCILTLSSSQFHPELDTIYPDFSGDNSKDAVPINRQRIPLRFKKITAKPGMEKTIPGHFMRRFKLGIMVQLM